MTTTIHAALLAPAGREDRAPGDSWQRSGSHGSHTASFYAEVLGGHPLRRPMSGRGAALAKGIELVSSTPELFRTVRSNIVQSIRAFRVPELAETAESLGQHFLYANCAQAQTRAEVLECIATSFLFPKPYPKTFDALSNCLTELLFKAGPQPGFVIVLEALPCAQKFDKEARETLLDVFRDAADYWADRKVPFRVFYSFA